MKKEISKFAYIVAIVGAIFAVNAVIFAWSSPTSNPPSGNVAPPVNTGPTTQFKSGAFGVGGLFQTYSNLIVGGRIQVKGGNPTAGAVLTASDTSGNATWQQTVGGFRGVENLFKCPLISINDVEGADWGFSSCLSQFSFEPRCVTYQKYNGVGTENWYNCTFLGQIRLY